MTPILLFGIVLFASFTQSVIGFGMGTVAIPLIITALGAPAATSLIVVAAFVTRVILMWRYHQALNVPTVSRMVVASLIALPFGLLVLQRLDSPIVPLLLGIVVLGYALYALLNLRLPEVAHPAWAYAAGFASGLLSGAYNTGGPPLVIYGTSRRWDPDEFRSNMQGVGLLNTTMGITLHVLAHDYTAAVMSQFLVVLPATLLGIAAGLVAARFVNPALFRRIVLVLLLIIGLNLIF